MLALVDIHPSKRQHWPWLVVHDTLIRVLCFISFEQGIRSAAGCWEAARETLMTA
jgi:hypothetical protein